MIEQPLVQLLLLLGAAVGAVTAFHRLNIPPVLGYLLVGVVLGPYTPGPVLEGNQLWLLAEYGIVFLLFTIGLSYSLPQLQALRHTVLVLGTAQVVLTTAVVGLLAWLAGLSPAVSFVVGAVFAQSSTTVISRQLTEQNEEHTAHGRLAVAMSVFQDVTTVPLIVIIPVLGQTTDAGALAASLGGAVAKAALAFFIVFFAGRALLRPFFHAIAARRSSELFTLAAIFVSLAAASITSNFGLSMAFGAFLAGMMLGETEFRHQIESAIRPFRDALLGLFFIGIGMLFQLSALPDIWHLALAGAVVLLVVKTLIVAPIVRWSGVDPVTAWRSALVLAVGGEFGFALLAIAHTGGVIGGRAEQAVLTAVLLSMVLAPFLIRYNRAIAMWVTGRKEEGDQPVLPAVDPAVVTALKDHVIICGYGRVGHAVAALLANKGVPFVAYDGDLARVAQGRAVGHLVLYGDVSDPGLFAAGHAERAALVVVTINHTATAVRIVSLLRSEYPHLPIIARAWDLEGSSRLLDAGATEAYPEAIEASLRLGAAALEMIGASPEHVDRLVQSVRDVDYEPVREGSPTE